MVQFWAHKEVIFVHYYALQFAYCAVVIAEDFDVILDHIFYEEFSF